MKLRSVLIALVILVATLSTQAAFTVVNYSGTYEMVTDKGTIPYNMFFQDGNKIRVEMSMPQGKTVSIMRMDKQTIWVLLPQNMYMEQTLTSDQIDKYQPGENFFKKAKKIGQEKVLGYKCDIYQYTDGKVTSTSSIAVGKGILLKSKAKTSQGTVAINAKTIKEGNNAASLFEIPSGYKKFTMKLPKMN